MFGVNWSWGGKVRFGINAGLGYSFGFNSDLRGMDQYQFWHKVIEPDRDAYIQPGGLHRVCFRLPL